MSSAPAQTQSPSTLTSSARSQQALLFPATTFSLENNLRTPLPITPAFLNAELCPRRLHEVVHLFWLAGRPLPPRPLHQQLLLSRQIVAAEPIHLHLVWKRGAIFVKPLPRYLFDQGVFDTLFKQDERLAKCARGILYSYTALVRYESDLHVAQDYRLLPKDMTWAQWQEIAQTFLNQYAGDTHKIYAAIDERYWYGELRLGRLNKIFRCRPRNLSDLLYGYSNLTAHTQKADVFSDNLHAIGACLAYVVIVLQAMQVGLSTERLSLTRDFQRACYGFSIFSILAPLVALGAVFAVFVFLFVVNFSMTFKFEKTRFQGMQQNPPRQQNSEKKLSHTV